ncbi:hypothetical protein GIB67_019306 [Kingdonia uniflora]|uniref:Cytochrome P450 n=1 Tax=Kingdonia uniflora TaxID=39325 RepID=A0A7J7L1D4_9MAGN|nr:hypothetical protein GIB67_019306 [Kingdonia uniflora]
MHSAVFLGGTDGITVTLTWALSLLLKNPDVLRKAQAEIDIHVGKERHVEESDVSKLVYLQSVLKETLRLYPPAPLSVPHEAMQDCTRGGFNVGVGTRVMVNLWMLHRDPRVWSDPLEFQPDRFLTSHADVNVRGQYFELIPFGSGRRSCPGISFALQILHLTLARLVHGFQLTTPTDLPIDMTPTNVGVTISRANPLEVICTPRLAFNLYE